MPARESTDSCDRCGNRTLGFTITTQGGTRVLSVASRRSKGNYCKACGNTRINELNAADKRRAERRKG